MKKIILLAINCRFLHHNLALFYLRNSIHKSNKNIEVTLISHIVHDDLMSIITNIYIQNPDYIAISVYIWNKMLVENLIVELKKILPEITIILGGPEVNYNAEKWLKLYPVIDYIICGSGEDALNDILHKKDNRTDNKIRVSNTDINDIPFPYTKNDLLDLSEHYLYYESSRGCPFECIYCLSSRDDHKLQFRTMDKIKNELDILIKHKIRQVTFMDRTFNIDKGHSRQIWQYLIDNNSDTRFHFEIHPAYLEDEDFAILEKAKHGLFKFEIGIQTTNEKTLAIIKRKDDWQMSCKNIIRLMEMGTIFIHLDLLVGLPGETLNIFKKSFNEVMKLMPHYLQIGFLKVLPGTELDKIKEDHGIMSMENPPYNVLKTGCINFDEVILLKKINRIITIVNNSGHFSKTFTNLLKCFDNPFNCLYHISINISDDFYTIQRNWIKTAHYLMDYINKYFNRDVKNYLDCLRWDWVMMSPGKSFPVEIQVEQDLQLKKMKNKLLPILLKEQIIPEKMSKSEYQKSSIFIPQSDKFSKIVKSKNPLFIICRDKEKVIYELTGDRLDFLCTIDV